MQNQSMLYGVIGLLVGVLITVFVASSSVNNNNQGMMKMMGMKMGGQGVEMMEEVEEMHKGGMEMSMNEMTDSLSGKTGDEFDKAFIFVMIDHHQGAIDMANLAKTNAKHDEIKKMADDIVSAQSREIEQMRQWQKTWSY